jgi:hypothetical protein
VRLECHEIAFSWQSSAHDVHTKLTILNAANQEFMKCQSSFDNILSFILSIGNYINGSSRFGQAVGVKIDTLNKLSTMKATDPSHGSLMNFLALMAESYSPDLVHFCNGWVGIWAAAEMSMKDLVTDLNQLELQLTKLQQEHSRIKDATTAIIGLDGSTEDSKGYCTQPLFSRLDHFLSEAKPRLTFIKNELRSVESQVESNMARYGENYRAIADEDPCKKFYSTLSAFARSLTTAHDQNTKRKLAELRAAKLAAEANAKLEAKAKLAAAGPVTVTGAAAGVSTKTSNVDNKKDDVQPADNIFGRLHSMQEESSHTVIGKFKRKLLKR